MTDTSEEMKMIDVGLFNLGMCCQTRHQLRFQQPSLKDLGIEEESVPSGYFDWLICPPESAAKIISDGLPQFKPERSRRRPGNPTGRNTDFISGMNSGKGKMLISNCISIDAEASLTI